MDELAEKREDIRKNTKASWQHKAISAKTRKEGKGHGHFDKHGGWHGKNAQGGHFESGFNTKDNS